MVHYEKLGLFAVAAILFVWLAPKTISVVMGSFAMMTTPRQRLADARPPARMPAGPDMTGAGFAREAVEAVGGDWPLASSINAVIVRLRERRQPSVARAGDQPNAIAAWKISVLGQAALYRITALAEAAAQSWNAHNPLGAALAAHALIGDAAALTEADRQLNDMSATADMPALDHYLTEQSFRDAISVPAVASGARSGAPVELLPASVRAASSTLGALTSVQAAGQFRLFGAMDKTGSSVRFAESECFDKAVLDPILAGLLVLEHAENVLADLDAIAARLASGQTA